MLGMILQDLDCVVFWPSGIPEAYMVVTDMMAFFMSKGQCFACLGTGKASTNMFDSLTR